MTPDDLTTTRPGYGRGSRWRKEMSYYALWQHKTGHTTTINRRSQDRLHRFDSKAERDAWADAFANAHAITKDEAARLSRQIYGAPLAALTTETFSPFEPAAPPDSEKYGALRVDYPL